MADKPKQILIYTRTPGYEFTLESPGKEMKEFFVGNQRKTREVSVGQYRTARATNHRVKINEGPDIERVRQANGYGIHFIEALPDPQAPSMSLYEMKVKGLATYDAKLNEMEKRGHGKVKILEIDRELEKLFQEREREKAATPRKG